MQVVLRYYGRLTDVTKKKEERIELSEGVDIVFLEGLLCENYVGFKEEVYAIFLNKKKVEDINTVLSNQDEISFMPPFSGG